MTKKDWVAILGTALVLTAGYIVYSNQQQTPVGYSENQQAQQTAITAAAAPQATGFFIGSSYVMIVTYDDSGFSPANVSIPKGGTVIFRNYSSQPMRVASNPHPSHDGYPTKDGCIGSTFDSCDNIPPKVSWSFTFDFPGTWGYHNHFNPSQNGTITVQ